MPDEKPFGVYTGQTNYWINSEAELAVLKTADGLTHHIRIVDHSKKWLRYVLRHDQKQYLLVSGTLEVLKDALVTCVICVAKGQEQPESLEEGGDD